MDQAMQLWTCWLSWLGPFTLVFTRLGWVRFVQWVTGIGLTQEEEGERRVDEQHVFHRVVSFLAAITARLLKRILGALDAPFGAIVANRGR